jgi:CheY-like chemotaxis protein
MPDGLCILVIEDEADTADSIALALRLAGHQVRVARDGAAGLAAAVAEPPDVVLLDIGLPGKMDGYEVANRLRQESFPRRPVLIAVTGHDEEPERKRSYRTGIDFHFTKPADPVLLTDILRRLQQLRVASAPCP